MISRLCPQCGAFATIGSLVDLCMYCNHDTWIHGDGSKCKCTREQIYPAGLLDKLKIASESWSGETLHNVDTGKPTKDSP